LKIDFFSNNLNMFCRYESLRSSRMDPKTPVPWPLGHSLVPGHFALRHGLWRYSIRKRRGNRKRPTPL